MFTVLENDKLALCRRA